MKKTSKTRKTIMLSIRIMQVALMPLVLWARASAAESESEPGSEACAAGGVRHWLHARANASGQWTASLRLASDPRLHARARLVRLDVRPAAFACGDVRTTALAVELTGPPSLAPATSSPPPPADSVSLRVPPPELGYLRAPTFPAFYKVHRTRRDWREALAACEGEGAHLVVVDSPAEATAVAYLLRPHAKALTRTLHAGFFAAEDDFYTVHGEHLNATGYQQWAVREPRRAAICGAIDLSGGLHDAFCSWNVRRSFVCEYGDAAPAARGAHRPRPPRRHAAGPTGAAAASAGSEYTRLPGAGAYKVHEASASWAEARAACEAEGAQLAVVDSQEEAAALRQHLASLHAARPLPPQLHIGVFSESRFSTIFGDDLWDTEYEKWADGEPNNSPCVVALHNITMATVDCDMKTAFVCEQAEKIL